MPRQRSAAYPSYTLNYCLDFVEKIYNNFGTTLYASREQIADALDSSIGGMVRKISTSVQYGLLELKSKEGYKITELYTKYRRPVPPSTPREYAIIALKSPPLYEQIFSKFENDIIPAEKPMSNIFFQNYGISEKSCDQAASILFENLREFELIDKERRLIFGSYQEADEIIDEIEDLDDDYQEEANMNLQLSTKNESTKEDQNKSHNSSRSNIHQNFDTKVPFNVPLKGRRTAQILIPDDMSSSDFDTLLNWVRLMKESF